MNLRWLFGNFTDPQYQLPRKEQFRLSSLAHKRHVRGFDFAYRTFLIVFPLIVILVALGPALSAIGRRGSNAAQLLALLAILLLLWPWSAWMYRSMYIVPIRKVMREAGYDLCLGCGYELRGLPPPPEVGKCPECGAARETASVDQAKGSSAAISIPGAEPRP